MLTLENGLHVQPVYLCSTTANCKNPSCRMDAEGFCCSHTTDKFFAKNPDSVKLLEELFNKFEITLYIDTDFTVKVIFEEKERK